MQIHLFGAEKLRAQVRLGLVPGAPPQGLPPKDGSEAMKVEQGWRSAGFQGSHSLLGCLRDADADADRLSAPTGTPCALPRGRAGMPVR
ncbi:hypothetical protein [Dyella agri]|jgi:hypothetical protein|uniref:Uncharacterized protein n=1 Tax=Dyella agri TaxID=1926869 RepID=A0ABW8KNL1_9GAMM